MKLYYIARSWGHGQSQMSLPQSDFVSKSPVVKPADYFNVASDVGNCLALANAPDLGSLEFGKVDLQCDSQWKGGVNQFSSSDCRHFFLFTCLFCHQNMAGLSHSATPGVSFAIHSGEVLSLATTFCRCDRSDRRVRWCEHQVNWNGTGCAGGVWPPGPQWRGQDATWSHQSGMDPDETERKRERERERERGSPDVLAGFPNLQWSRNQYTVTSLCFKRRLPPLFKPSQRAFPKVSHQMLCRPADSWVKAYAKAMAVWLCAKMSK